MAKTIAINPSWYWPDDVPRLIGVPPYFLDHMLVARWARRRPETVALADADQSVTYAELWDRTQAVSAGLRARLGDTDRVVLWEPSGMDGVVALMGAMAARTRPLLMSEAATGAAELPATVGAGLAIVQAPAQGPAELDAVEPAELEEEGRSGTDQPEGTGGAPRAKAGGATRAGGPGETANGSASEGDTNGSGGVRGVQDPAIDLVTSDGWLAGHSHYSLVSGALSMASFLELENSAGWLCAMPLTSWEGLYSVLVPLYAGTTAVVCGPEGAQNDIAGAVDDYKVGYTVFPYEETRNLARRQPRRLVDALKRNLNALLLSTDRPFSPGDRRKVRKALDVPVLTMFGLAETGPILASHPSWYVDESVGIPVTNVEVQPANPQTGEPLDTLWELLDYATMVIRAPLLMSGYEGPAADDERLASRLEEGWFKTWAMASFDANGMMYLVEG